MIVSLLNQAVTQRLSLFDERHEAAFRLFNGFLEGFPDLVIDLYAQTAVIHNYAREANSQTVQTAQTWLLEQFNWLEAIVLKQRHAATDDGRRGVLLFGSKPARKIREHGVWYAVDLLMNQDASFYLDTRNLRRWLIDEMAGRSVLNTFAYTGSLGVAATAGKASRVVQTDLNKRFLNVAKTSHTLNGFPIYKPHFQAGDFWSHMNRLKRQKERFDCVILDPPFFADTARGRVDLAANMPRLINKVRPIVANHGRIIAINNALFVSGADYMAQLHTLTAGGYVEIEQQIDVASDFTIRTTPFVTDPTPFNHTTKIAILRIRHKS